MAWWYYLLKNLYSYFPGRGRQIVWTNASLYLSNKRRLFLPTGSSSIVVCRPQQRSSVIVLTASGWRWASVSGQLHATSVSICIKGKAFLPNGYTVVPLRSATSSWHYVLCMHYIGCNLNVVVKVMVLVEVYTSPVTTAGAPLLCVENRVKSIAHSID